MTGQERDYLGAIETHDVAQIRALLDAGLPIDTTIKGRSLTTWLTEMYTRSPRFSDCLRLLLERGAELEDPATAAVLLDDAEALEAALDADPELLEHRTTLRSAFSPLDEATLLHVAAEFQALEAVRILLARGADPNSRTALDASGMNGHTPIFHTVNTYRNQGGAVLEMLLQAGARADVRLAGITWGRGFEWDTTLFDVTPVSYAQLGLLPQMHRDERQVYQTVSRLLAASDRRVPPLENVPNEYVNS